MGFLSLILAIIALVLTIIAFIPPLGFLNWVFIPFSLLVLGINVIFYYINLGLKTAAKAGIIICLAALVIGIFRLTLLWGIL